MFTVNSNEILSPKREWKPSPKAWKSNNAMVKFPLTDTQLHLVHTLDIKFKNNKNNK